MNQRAQAANELEKWWHELADEEIERTVPKALEYGSGDLVDIGRTLAKAKGDDHIGDKEAAELGVYFYLVGKMARWTDAIRNGRRVSDDTIFDIGVYIRMVQRIRSAGGWPGVDLDQLEAGPEWRKCCHTIKGLDHLAGCKAVRGEEMICTCEPMAERDPGCPSHGNLPEACTCTEQELKDRKESPVCPRHGLGS